MAASKEHVFVVDDDVDVLESVTMLLRTEGWSVRAYQEPVQFLETVTPEDAGCLVLDVRLPGMDGLALQAALQERGIEMPIVFISGHGDIPMAIQAVQAGALDFLEKPFSDDALIERVQAALDADRERRDKAAGRDAIEQRLKELTDREREVMEKILLGHLNKVIAYDLGLSVRTVEVHRARILEKLQVRNAQEMVRQVLSSRPYKDWLL